ncbi:12006_t:CDS:2 [Diversispora eburnea]|uniref:12006_t:CDS:1 n=1 Tax=Diversispora eburnea TaxID=1213867 RepID=A0A9N8YS51_9GLOM|nr:12006_t:CDS:2 [Diversispora eburnea]
MQIPKPQLGKSQYATSVSSKQCVSTSKDLITDNRNWLTGKTVRACMCLRSWWIGPLQNEL